ncbi:calpain-like cysteine protease [Heterostelium album PN500]|uniref:non-specific serine/threonine protein kinase n=1 Tax=Heterostelium pallidum (strain ATCC 26659 / Pp 5 / PN500) TaxID=670386 RepID=D3BN17_HETP5|nr:calpain-like cysteine protease [Heterostelium album PN500]EFA77379.1 calpain-like cysteine protease [Heterostelium album PN500]|eukprot:XP_020429508.1 calpain-like cysteine protease [Heterostelium album PN500]
MEDQDLFKLPDGIKDPATEFELLESLGRGSFGAVYKARHKKTGHIVAVKQVPVNEDFQEILKEINIMKQCRSKYVVQYYGNYFKGETCWIIMEYCAMGSVSDMMNITSQILNEEQIALVCYSTLKGLYYLHKNSKIHRDIKPGNILVTLSGECKLADFGVSGQLSERTRKRNTVIGTPFFLAPEVIQEVGYDSKADIWALGISAIEMAEFHPPYHDLHPMRVLFMIPTAESPKLKEAHKWSPEFSDFIRLCLAKEQSQRPSAKDLLKHPFFEKKVKGSYVMRTLTDSAQEIIDVAGGREKAIKEAAERKARLSGESSDFTQSGSVDDPDSDEEEEDLLEKNNKKHQQEEEESGSSFLSNQNLSKPPLASVYVGSNNNSQQPAQLQPHFTRPNLPTGNNNRPSSMPPQQPPLFPHIQTNPHNHRYSNPQPSSSSSNSTSPASNEPLNELDSLLNGIILNSGSSNNNQPKRPTSTGNLSNSFINNSLQQQQQQQQHHQSSSIESSPAKPSLSFSRQLSNNSVLQHSNSPSTTTANPKAPASELDDLLEQMLNPSFGTKQHGLTPKSSPKPSRANVSPQATTTRVSGVWSGRSAGGCANYYSWRYNPQFLLQLAAPTNLRIALRQTGDKLVHIGFYFARANPDISKRLITLARDSLVPGVDITFLRNTEVSTKVMVEPGNYIIIPATFDAKQEGTFELEVSPSEVGTTLKLAEILPDRDYRSISGSFEWRGQSAGGSFSGSSATWKDNPKFMFEISVASSVAVILGKEPDVSKDIYIGFYVFKVVDKAMPYVNLTASNLVAKTNFLNGNEVIHNQSFAPGAYIVVPCTYDSNQEGSFTVACFSEAPLNRIELKEQVCTIVGEWKGITAGGCLNHTSWRNNPQYMVTNTGSLPTKLTIIMDQLAKDSALLQFAGFYVTKSSVTQVSPAVSQYKKLYTLTPKDIIGNTEFINDFQVYYNLVIEPNTSCIIIPCTFTPGIESSYALRVVSSQPSCVLTQLPDWGVKRVSGEWRGASCGGRYSNTSSSWTQNPRFQFNLMRGGRYTIILNQSEKQVNHGIGFYFFKTFPDGNLKELVCKSGFVSGKEVVVEGASAESIQGTILPATFEAGIPDTFSVTVYSEYEFEFVPPTQAFAS